MGRIHWYLLVPFKSLSWEIHFLGDVLSRAPHVEGEAIIYKTEVPFIIFSDAISGYSNYHFFGPIVRAMNGHGLKDGKESFKLEKMDVMVNMPNERLLCNEKLYFCRLFYSRSQELEGT